jgi:hypothetical protein
MIAKLVDAVGLAGEINSAVTPLKLHTPYQDSRPSQNRVALTLCSGDDGHARSDTALRGLGGVWRLADWW